MKPVRPGDHRHAALQRPGDVGDGFACAACFTRVSRQAEAFAQRRDQMVVIARAQTEKNALIEEIRAGELENEIDEADPAADAEQHALGKRLAGVWSGHALMRQNVLHGRSLAVMPAELSVAFKLHRGLLLWRGRMLKSMLKGTGGMLKRSQQLLPEPGRIAALDHEIMCVVEYEKIA